jgi:hypothetical protein
VESDLCEHIDVSRVFIDFQGGEVRCRFDERKRVFYESLLPIQEICTSPYCDFILLRTISNVTVLDIQDNKRRRGRPSDSQRDNEQVELDTVELGISKVRVLQFDCEPLSVALSPHIAGEFVVSLLDGSLYLVVVDGEKLTKRYLYE